MPEETRRIFERRYRDERKSAGFAYVLFVFGFFIGADGWYLEGPAQIAKVILRGMLLYGAVAAAWGAVQQTIADPMAVYLYGVGQAFQGAQVALILLAMLTVADVVTLSRQVRFRNQEIEERLMRDLQGGGADAPGNGH